MTCHAVQVNDQMMCGACGLAWDVDDPEPPACRKVDRRTKLIKALEKPPAQAVRPESIPDDVIMAMGRAAHRVFLDWRGS